MGGSRSSLQSSMTHEVRELHIAVMRNDVATVMALAKTGIDLDRPWYNGKQPSVKDGSTPLCQAVSLNHRGIAEVLLDEGALVNKPNSFGFTPLHKAAYHGRVSLTHLLIASGGDVHRTDRNLNTPLHLCIQNAPIHNSAETVHCLIASGARVNQPNRFGEIALHYSAAWGLGKISEILIKAGSSIDCADLKWKTPLYCCVQAIPLAQKPRNFMEQQLPAIKVLLMSGCDSLNLASWIHKLDIVNRSHRVDENFYRWYVSAQPESLKHLCRQTIQHILRYHDADASQILALPLPPTVNNYLARKLL